MNIFRAAVVSCAVVFATFNPAAAQWAVPNHAVPTGKGGGVIGYGSAAPGTAGLPLASNGPSVDPSFQSLPNAGLATMPADTAKCNPTGSAGAVQDCTASQMATTFSFPSLTTNNSWSGDQYFGGRPWFDVLSTAHGCAAATGNGAVDNTAAIQCHVDYMFTNFIGGTVFFPCGTYLIQTSGGVHLKGSVGIRGASLGCVTIDTGVDTTLFTVDSATCRQTPNMNISDVWLIGFQNPAAATDAFVVQGCGPIVRDVIIWFGHNAVNEQGTDARFNNVFACGYNTAIASTGANFYSDSKFDDCGITMNVAFNQNENLGVGAPPQENTITDTDFSTGGTSININDSTGVQSIFKCTGCVMGKFIVQNGLWTALTATEVAGPITLNGNTSIVSSWAQGAGVTPAVTGGFTLNACGNIHINGTTCH